MNDVQEGDFVIECFTPDEHTAIGLPPDFTPTFPPAPPLNISIGMQARRRSVDSFVEINLTTVEIFCAILSR